VSGYDPQPGRMGSVSSNLAGKERSLSSGELGVRGGEPLLELLSCCG